MDVVGLLPANGNSNGAADILGLSALAYGAGTAVVVSEVRQLHVACTLHGAHRAPVTAVKWCPAHYSSGSKKSSHLRLASGDSTGGVVVWDVLSASPVARLDDLSSARELLKEYTTKTASSENPLAAGTANNSVTSNAAAAGVASLAWVLPSAKLLAVVVSPALLLLWDVAGGAVVWRRELSSSGSELFTQMAVAPLDSRQLCLSGSNGALVVLQLTDPARDKVQLQQYRVNVQDGDSNKAMASAAGNNTSSLQALFAVAPGLLVLLLPRELVVFDLDLGQPAASSPLPSGLPSFAHLLGVYGGGVCQGVGDEGGLDFAYCTHTDGSLSVWVRVPGELRFKLGNISRLFPPPVKGAGSQVTLTVVKAGLWHQLQQQDLPTAQTAANTASITHQLTASLAAIHLTREGAGAGAAGARKDEGSGVLGATAGSAATLSSQSLLVLGITSDGRQWQWRVPLPQYPKRSSVASRDAQPMTATGASIQVACTSPGPTTVTPQLAGLLHGLPGGITATALHPRPIMLLKQLHRVSGYAPSTTVGTTPTRATSSTAAAAADEQLAAITQNKDPTQPADDRISGSSRAAGRETQEARAQTAAAPAECVVLGAAATSTGHVEIFSVRRGTINPLAIEVSMSHAVHKDVVRGVRWIGNCSQLVSFSSEKTSSGAWKNSLVITDVRTGRSLPFRDNLGSEGSPMLGIRASPSGTYLLLLLKGAPCELWATAPRESSTTAASAAVAAADAGADGANSAGAMAQQVQGSLSRPWRVRLLDLPFSAVEWVTAEEDMQQGLVNVWAATDDLESCTDVDAAAVGAARDADAAILLSPPDRGVRVHGQHAKSFSRTLSALTSPSMSVAGDAALDVLLPVELLAFGLKDGRSGVLSVRGRKVSDTCPRRPSSGPAPGDSVATALAAVWPLLVLGDADGTLLAWDVTTGRCSSLATGYGVIRRIQLAPASPPMLSGAVGAVLSGQTASSSGSERLRLAVLFTGGQFGVYEVGAAGRIRQTAAHPGACSRVCKALDISWTSMPGSTGAGSILSVVLEDGSLCLVDVAQSPIMRPSLRQRQALLQQALHTPSPAQVNWVQTGISSCAGVPVVLMSPRPLGSSVLLPHSWVMLLRHLLQAGISQEALIYLSSNSTDDDDDDDDVRNELMLLLPKPARATQTHITAHTAAASLQHQQVPGMSKTTSSPLLQAGLGAHTAEMTMQSNSARALADVQQQQVGGVTGDPSSSNALCDVAGSQWFGGDLVRLLRCIAQVHGSGQLLHADEWHAYLKALSSGLVARRMAVAARLSGDQDEARFWSALPATLASVKVMQAAIQQQQEAASGTPTAAAAQSATTSHPRHSTADELDIDTVAGYGCMVQQAVETKAQAAGVGGSSGCVGTPKAGTRTTTGAGSAHAAIRTGSGAVPGRVRCSSGSEQLMTEGLGAIKIAAAGRAVRLWDEDVVLSGAQERLLWHEALPSQVFEAESMLERRLLAYVVLGDFATAVAFLLSMPPESSVSYYRSVVCALALAATASLQAQSADSNRSMQAAATLHLQAAKVVSAHAASIGDNLLGVPLNCSAGLNADAVTLLQEAGMWQYAAVLIARALTGSERAQALSRWASHLLRQEGSVWRCVGILTTAGCLSAAAQVLHDMGLPDCAEAYVRSCEQAGLLEARADTNSPPQQHTEVTQHGEQQALHQGMDCLPGAESSMEAQDASIGQAEEWPQAELFDLLSHQTCLMSSSRLTNESTGTGGQSAAELVREITTAYTNHLCTLISRLC